MFVSGAVYGRQYLFERGKLRGKRTLLSVTTGGPEAAFGPGSLNGDILDILMPIHRGILGFTGMTVLPPFVLARAETRLGWRPIRACTCSRDTSRER